MAVGRAARSSGGVTLHLEHPQMLDATPDLRAFLAEYLEIVVSTLHADGGPKVNADTMLAATLDHLEDYQPPQGRTTLVRDADGRLQASIFVRMIRSDVAEMKRLYVRPMAQRLGLGQRLTEKALDDARSMGAREIFLDTLAAFTPARRLYERLGFRYIDSYPESENPGPMIPFTVCMAKTL
ncbi:MAG: GNAT family N-acetyltransferase [Pseudomonadota bacterium]